MASGIAAQRMDRDGDGREYLAWMRYAFDARDLDHDGVLSPAELPGGRGPPITRAQHLATLTARFLRAGASTPRRFGCLLWQAPGEIHPLLAELGPEPLSEAFDGDHLFRLSRGRTAPVKTFLMDQRIVVGVGNIYAAESLFQAGISPLREAGDVSRARYARLAEAAKAILGYAIQRGGTTLRDFISPDGAPGYFEQELSVYGREGEACKRCGRTLRHAQRLVRSLPALSNPGDLRCAHPRGARVGRRAARATSHGPPLSVDVLEVSQAPQGVPPARA
ncbi:hypothetical protein NB693_20420 [Pantoea ananatis]|uniref:hypothetical protein n=1 Tax=Pantoea ananas TaxID=553 RepID=UPI0022202239|nr:hypothetical protein [Pantoea ananatis]